jgi:CzcA family heavy metal efflux pump
VSGKSRGLLNTIVHFAIRFRGIVIALASLLVGYGLYGLSQARYDVFPEFAPPQVVIQTEAPGLAPEQVEVLVTQPIENAINGVPGIQSLRSASIQGLSLATVVFDPKSDIYRDRQVVAERLASITGQLPSGVQPPAMTPLTSSTSTVLVAGLTSKTRSLMDLRTIADWTIRPRLLAVPGVAKVAIFGGEVRQIQVQVHPDGLIRFNVGLNDVISAATRATGVRGAGFIETSNQRIILQTEGQALTPREVGRAAIVNQNGTAVTLANVADVVAAPEPPIGAAAVMGRPGVDLVVSQQYGANTLEVTKGVEEALRALRPALDAQSVTLRPDLFRPANFIVTSTRNVRAALLLGGLLVVVVLFVFLFDWRTAAITCTAIPLSLLAAVLVMMQLGFTLNTMTLGGLAIAIGEVVDDAVIDVENILRRLRQNRSLGGPKPAWRVVLDASIEVRSAVVYATFAVILVFLPILTLSGIAGRLFAPLGAAYIFAVLASLVVALTVTPALSMVLLARRDFEEREPPVVRWTKNRYVALLARVERHPRSVLLPVGALALFAILVLPFFGGAFLPELREGHFIVHMSAVPGTSLGESLRIGGRVTQALLRLPAVRSVSQQVGRAEKADDVFGSHYSEFHVDLKPLGGEAAEFAQADIRRVLAGFPGVNFAVKTFLTERVEETLSGYTAAVVVNIYGNDLDALDAKAQEVARALSDVPGATEVQVQSPPGMPRLAVRLREPDLLRWGFQAVDVLDAVRTAYQGDDVGQVYDGNRVFGVSVILDPESRGSITEVGDLPLRNGAGTYVRLRQLADVYETPGRYQVLHQGARRVQAVTANVAGRDVASFAADAKRRIESAVSLPPGSYVEFAGAAEAQSKSKRDLLLHSLIAATGIVLLLSVVTRHWRNLVLILANLPFALVGGVLAVFALGGTLSLGSMVGFVTLFGITLRNSIMMISHYEHLVAVEGMEWGPEAATRGASERLAPILMTSLVTALGLLPLAVGMHAPGREIEGPMAVVILGGLMTSMALNLLVLPALALRYGRFERQGPLEI